MKESVPQLKNDRDLWRVLHLSSAVSLGAMGAFIASIRGVRPELVMQLDFWTAVGFFAGAAGSWAFWHLVPKPDDAPDTDPAADHSRKRWLAVLSVFFCLATLVGFALGLRGTEHDKLVEIVKGAAMAVIALSMVGWVFWQIVRFLEKDSDAHPHQGDAADFHSKPRGD